jgi:hypothetical protein
LVGNPKGRKSLDRSKYNRWEEDMEWINLAVDRDQWRALANTARNLRVYKRLGISCFVEQLPTFQE